MNVLAKLLGSMARVKILRLFLLNQDKFFTLEEIIKRCKVSKREARYELTALTGVDLLKHRSQRGWQINHVFPFNNALLTLLVNTVPFRKDEIARRLKSVGRIKAIIVTGIFVEREESRTDILIVGDDVRKNALDNAIHAMEAEIGREIRYGVLETEDFKYRLGIYDKFIRDILDYPHEKIYDKIGL